jgi:hypothetical protein
VPSGLLAYGAIPKKAEVVRQAHGCKADADNGFAVLGRVF